MKTTFPIAQTFAVLMLGIALTSGCSDDPIPDLALTDVVGPGLVDSGGEPPCLPDCGYRECGPEPSCGYICGACGPGKVCDKGRCIPEGCVPDCEGLECGLDPLCGGYCGSCAAGFHCVANQCIAGDCEPDCEGRACGPDPVCLESCGVCPAGDHCREGECIAGDCEPDCEGRECGPDPVCGVSCGECGDGEICEDGLCVDGPCEPDCEGRECGPDPVCDVSCGDCGDGEICEDGVCVPVALDRACDNPDDLAIINSLDAVVIAQACVIDAECGFDEECIALCIANETGISLECAECYAALATCGVRNCLGFCLADEGGPACMGCLETHCLAAFEVCAGITWEGCQPECDGLVCGPDPNCGFSCGTCDPGYRCEGGACVPVEMTGACNNEDDLAALAEAEPFAVAQACVLDAGCDNDHECLSACIADQTGVSEDCSLCWGDLALCGVDHCLLICYLDPEGDDCTGCLNDLCKPAFETCAGITWDFCVPDCTDLECGPDPICGQSCGECPATHYCEHGRCVPGPCVPDCTDLECGLDPICGESCGECAANEECISGRCRPVSTPGACNNAVDLAALNSSDAFEVAETCLIDSGCGLDERCLALCIVKETGVSEDCAMCWSALAFCGVERCSSHCLGSPEGDLCIECLEKNCLSDFEDCAGITWELCEPDCTDLECGHDPICGSSCGTCPPRFTCENGRCVPGACVPDCTDLECGPDPDCGVSCGECLPSHLCVKGRCVPDVLPNACDNPDDLAALDESDTFGVALGCLLKSGCGTDAFCLADCISDQTGLSQDCAYCWAALSICGLDSCLVICNPDMGSATCRECISKQCGADFEICAGITWS